MDGRLRHTQLISDLPIRLSLCPSGHEDGFKFATCALVDKFVEVRVHGLTHAVSTASSTASKRLSLSTSERCRFPRTGE